MADQLAELWNREIDAANAAADRAERCLDQHGYGCARPECGRGPATSADLLELDAVPEPIDSAAPAATYLPGARPVGSTAETRPIRAGRTTDDIHARTLARART